MSETETLLRAAVGRLEADDSLLACELFCEDANGEYQASVKVYRFSEALLNSQPETGGLLVNGSRTGRPTKYPFAALAIGDSFIMALPLHKCHSVSRYWAKKCGRAFRMQKETENTTRVERIS